MRRCSTKILGALVLALCRHAVAAEDEVPGEEVLQIPMWDYSGELRGGVGYKDNVLLSHTNGYGSAFWHSGAEFMAFRLPSRGWQFTFYAEGADVRYFDSPAVSDEQYALAVAQLSKDLGRAWKTTVGLNYLYQNQVFDYSVNYQAGGTVGQILGHTLIPRWAVRKTLGAFWLEGEMTGIRQWLDDPLDSYWQYGPRASLGYAFGNGSELAVNYHRSRLDYDNREQADAAGGVVTNSSLSLNVDTMELALTWLWDEKRKWQTVTALGYEGNRDNGSGFFDYNVYRLSQRVRFRDENWEATAGVRVGYYGYASQTVSSTDTALREKTMLSVTMGVERRLAKHLKAHASYTWNRSFSNQTFDDYEANVIMGGAALTF